MSKNWPVFAFAYLNSFYWTRNLVNKPPHLMAIAPTLPVQSLAVILFDVAALRVDALIDEGHVFCRWNLLLSFDHLPVDFTVGQNISACEAFRCLLWRSKSLEDKLTFRRDQANIFCKGCRGLEYKMGPDDREPPIRRPNCWPNDLTLQRTDSLHGLLAAGLTEECTF